MTDGRPYARADYLAIKAATRRGCEAAGTLESIAERTRVDAAQLSRYGNVEEKAFVPLDVAMDIDKLAASPIILRAVAEREGYKLVPHEVHARTTDILGQVADLIRKTSAVTSEAADCKPVTPARAREIESEAAAAIDALSDLQDECRRIMAGEGPRIVQIK